MKRAERIAAIAQRCEAATGGEWKVQQSTGRYGQTLHDVTAYGLLIGPLDRADDAAFIAAARQDVPWLLSQLAKAEAVVEAAREVTWLANPCGSSAGNALDHALAAYDAEDGQ